MLRTFCVLLHVLGAQLVDLGCIGLILLLLEEVVLDTAMDELITTGEIAEDIAAQTGGDSEQIEELIAFVKANVAARELETEEDVLAVIAEGEQKFGVTLSESHKSCYSHCVYCCAGRSC